jgi:hypothetical protein
MLVHPRIHATGKCDDPNYIGSTPKTIHVTFPFYYTACSDTLINQSTCLVS